MAQAVDVPVELVTATGTLYGSMRRPGGSAPVPVALIIAGSGPTDRDGNSPIIGGRNDSLKLLADALAARGIASVRYDKRGIAASAAAGPDESALRFGAYVDDAAAWVAQLAADPRHVGVVVIGHSEGALIGNLAALRSPARAWIGLAAPAERAADILRRQLAGRLAAALAERNGAILDELEAGHTVSDVPADLAALYRPSVQPYLISWFAESPTEAIAKLPIACLLVQGDTDVQIRVDDARALHAAQPACTLHIIAGMNHVLKSVPADLSAQLASYGDPTLPLAAKLGPALDDFLSSTAVQAALREGR